MSLIHRQLFRNRGCPATATVTMLSGNGTAVIADGHAVITVLSGMEHPCSRGEL
ncbi:hypothetical protein ACR78H_21425 [Sphingobacterium siyangense]|uniref:hypothetical protein n=1 Tax=Sphingobacterium siyangense TaxID=459529 RepID=UPI003DA4A9DC